MTIAMVLPSFAAAGMEAVVARMAAKLARRGRPVVAFCLEELGPMAAGLTEAGVEVVETPSPGLGALVAPTALMEAMRARDVRVVHAHSGAWNKAAMAARRIGAERVVLTSHGFVEPEQWHETLFMRLAAPMADHIVAVSEHLADNLRGRGLPARKISVIRNGVDLDRFQPGRPGGRLRAALGVSATTRVIATVARLAPVKNQAILIEAFARLRADGADAALVLIGDGELRDALAGQALALGVGEAVRFWGVDADVASLYPDMDVFCLPSRAEGTSISLLEAMASGVACVATDVGGNTAALDQGLAGVLTPSEDAVALAAALGRLLSNADARAEYAAAGRAHVAAAYGDDAMVDAYEALYEGAAAALAPAEPASTP